MYLPQGVSGTPYIIQQPGLAASPSIVTDATGKQYLVNASPYQLPMQYQIASTPGLKVTIYLQFI